MGIVHSSTRAIKGKDEETQLIQIPRIITCMISSRDSLPKLSLILAGLSIYKAFFLRGSIYKALKGLLGRVGSIFHLTKPADPLLPLQNPSLLQQTTPISSPTTFLDQDWERHYDLWCQEEIYSSELDYDDQVVVSVHQEENAPFLAVVEEEKNSTEEEPLLLQQTPPICSPTTFPDQDWERLYDLWCQEVIYLSELHYDDRVVVSVHQEENAPFLEEDEMNSTEEEVVVEVKCVVDVAGDERWIKHYSSRHRILLVGEGNFSFSACLALAFRCAPNIIATSLDSRGYLLLLRYAPLNSSFLFPLCL